MTDETRAQRSGSDKITATRSPTSLTARAWNASVQREQLPQSVKRYAAWLAARPDRKTPGLYRGGQAVAAQALGLTIRTVRDAERKLIDNGAMARERRGVRQTTYSRMTLLPPPFNRQKLPVEVGSQPEDGGWLKTGSQPAETAATNVLRSDTSALVLKPTGHPSVFIAAVVPTAHANARLEDGERVHQVTEKPQLTLTANHRSNSTAVVNHRVGTQLGWNWRPRRSAAA